jgi:diketogulonate reductase-like aldo/keto reductase
MSTAATVRFLSDGNSMPMLGLGVWQMHNDSECVNAVRWALELGYRHIDTAQEYGNEESVGRALRESGVAREDVFVTTKFFPQREDPLAELEHSLRRLRVDYVDLYLVHWPQGGPTWAWTGMERAHERGYARSIGVSNFNAAELSQLLSGSTIPPAVDQIQFNPYSYRRQLLEACDRADVVLEAYSPLGTGRHLSDDVVIEIADRLGRTPAQVLLRWCIERSIPVIPKSAHRDRIAENAGIFDYSLPTDDIARLDALDRMSETAEAVEDRWWP